ncbi:hypothetical protein MRX96_047011 [Rhipicephalus microplus]
MLLASPAHAINSSAPVTTPAQAIFHAMTAVTTLAIITRSSSCRTTLNHKQAASTNPRLLPRPPRQPVRTVGTPPSLCRAHCTNLTSPGEALLSKVSATSA